MYYELLNRRSVSASGEDFTGHRSSRNQWQAVRVLQQICLPWRTFQVSPSSKQHGPTAGCYKQRISASPASGVNCVVLLRIEFRSKDEETHRLKEKSKKWVESTGCQELQITTSRTLRQSGSWVLLGKFLQCTERFESVLEWPKLWPAHIYLRQLRNFLARTF